MKSGAQDKFLGLRTFRWQCTAVVPALEVAVDGTLNVGPKFRIEPLLCHPPFSASYHLRKLWTSIAKTTFKPVYTQRAWRMKYKMKRTSLCKRTSISPVVSNIVVCLDFAKPEQMQF